MHDSRPPDRTTVHHRYTMKASSRLSPGASSYCQTATHPARSSRPSKTTTTPLVLPRPPYSVGQNSPPMRSPGCQHDVRAASPNYFGLVVESSNDPRESSGLARDNWSLASASVKSFAAALPKQVSLEPNADFEAFRRQVDVNKGKSFSLPTPHHVQPVAHAAPVRPRPPRWHTHTSDAGSESSMVRSVFSIKERPASRMDVDHDSLHDYAYVSADSKRNSEACLVPSPITALPTLESPRPMDSPRRTPALAPSDDRHARMSMTENKAEPAAPFGGNRAATLPSRLDATTPPMISGADLEELLNSIDDDRLLLLDIRSSQSYAQSRIRGALNLCIPTTLLKRPTFNIQKLQQTFQGGSGSGKFAEWQSMEWIVVYDAHASDNRDAVTAQNMIKKFTNEGFAGHTAILRGGFGMFQKSMPHLVDEGPTAPSPGRCVCNGRINGGLAPVIGGVNLPQTTGGLDHFFSNIRQNIDLADGVGQFEVARPPDLESPLLPQWLREAASKSDRGKKVSDKFLHIEQDEQTRMRDAYAAFKLDKEQTCKFQLSGVEKGIKNRYKDILPFDHARVRLQDRPTGACDYINASHLSASRSHKRYIATQGPLPATFDDFWSVIWEQDVRVIVMLTAESEGGQLKCHPYWQGKEFGPIRLRLLSEKKVSLDMDKHRAESGTAYPTQMASEWGRKRANTTTTLESTTPAHPQRAAGQTDAPYVLVRKIALSHSAYPFAPIRETTHLYFPAWPDFGTPAQPSHLLALVELANLMQRASLPVETSSIVGAKVSPPECGTAWHDEPVSDPMARPMLVHCSAGCGRTGTFCAVDSVIDMLKRQRQARVAVARAPGSEGDTTMMDYDEELSPRTVKTVGVPGVFDASSAPAVSNTPAPPGTDPHWPEHDTADLVQKTVEDFREQRLSMVQSLRQYVLCYETILEWVNRTQDRAINTMGGRRRSGSLQQVRHDG